MPRGSAGGSRAHCLARMAAGLAAGARVDLPDSLALWRLAGGRPRGLAPVAAPDPARALGAELEARLSDQERKAGAHYTPRPLAERVAAAALGALPAGPGPVCDPACGAGALLLAAGDRLAASGLAPSKVAGELLWGADLDPLAAAVAEAAVALWSGGVAPPTGRLTAGDPLLEGRAAWPVAPPAMAAVLGNPPFQGQLASATARSRAALGALRSRYGEAVAPYVDTAALFLLVGVELARPGARVAMVQPASVAASRDAAGVRAALARRAGLVGIEAAPDARFRAAVGVCVVVLEAGAAGGADWAAVVAEGAGVPALELAGRPLGGLATLRAGFRAEYYGLVPHVLEAPPGLDPPARLITAGAIDLGSTSWGQRPIRFANRRWQRPQVDLEGLERSGGRAWVHLSRLRAPKVLVASQTAVLEAAPDTAGTAAPSTPVVSVVPSDPEALQRITVLLCSPATSAWAARRAGGTGLSPGTMRASAGLLAGVPLPRDERRWAAAASALAAWVAGGAPIDRWAGTICRAQGLTPTETDRVLDWWTARLARLSPRR